MRRKCGNTLPYRDSCLVEPRGGVVVSFCLLTGRFVIAYRDIGEQS